MGGRKRAEAMPLTAFQKEILSILVGNRSEASHFAGGLVLNAPEDSARYSHDFDVFHEAVADLVAASENDVAALEAPGSRSKTCNVLVIGRSHPLSERPASIVAI